MKKHKRIFAILLALAMIITFMPGMAFALEELEQEGGKVLTKKTIEPNIVTPDIGIADNEELLWEYLNKEIAGGDGASNGGKLKMRKAPRGNQLEGYERVVYENLKAQIEDFTDPDTEATLSDAVFYIDLSVVLGHELERINVGEIDPAYKVTNEELQAIEAIIYNEQLLTMLLMDMPYDFFWYDKTHQGGCRVTTDPRDIYSAGNYSFFMTSPRLEYSFTVSEDYRDLGSTKTTAFDLNKINAVKDTISNAEAIIENASGLSDYNKIVTYKDKICEYTSYNHDASNNSDTPYGDPWQLIYVFDKDPNTKVVCEDYSKAFQYLCDHSDFTDIDCYTVTGDMTGATGSGGHMWNILHMADGRNYLADITNSDSGTVGYVDKQYDPDGSRLFLNGYADGDVNAGYSYSVGNKTISYAYDDDTKGLKGLFSEEELTMSSDDYDSTVHYISSLELTLADTACGTTITLTGGEPDIRPEVDVTSDDVSRVEEAYWGIKDSAEPFEGNMEGTDTYTAFITVALDPNEECIYSGNLKVKVNGVSVTPSSIEDSKVTLSVDKNVVHDLTVHEADPVNCILKYWSCNNCGKNFSDAAGTKELTDTTDIALKTAKDKALAELDKIDLSKYSGAERTNVENAIKAAKEQIRKAATVGAVTFVQNSASKTIGTQKTDETKQQEAEAQKAADAKAQALAKASNINKATVTAKDIKKASNLGATTVTLGKKVKTIKKNAFKGTKIKTIIVKTKKLKAKSVKGSLKGSKVKTIKVQIGSKKVNKQYVKKYKKIFTKKNAGKKAAVK